MNRTVRGAWVSIVVLEAVVAAALTACGSSSGRAVPPPATTTVPATTVTGPPTPAATGRAALELREVLGTFPNSDPATSSLDSCNDPTNAPTAANTPPVLPAGDNKTCYLLGPILLSGRDLATASVVTDPSTGAPQVELHFAGNSFETKIGGPMVGQQVAIIYRGVVESAPTIAAGTGEDIAIAGSFTAATASALVRQLA